MDFGVFILSQKKVHKDIVRNAKLAEDVGFKFLGLIDSQFNFMDVYCVATAVALGTEKIQVGPFVTNPLTRHPSVTASAMASLNVMSEGRAFLGYGRGDSAVKMLGLHPAKWRDLEQSLKDIRSWMRGEPVDVEGAPAPLSMPWAQGEPEIPIDVTLFGPRGARTAGQLGDIASAACPIPEAARWFHDMTQAEAAKAGRGRIPFEVSISAHVSDDPAKAREKVRMEPAEMSNLLWHLMRTYPIDTLPPELVKGFEWLADEDDWWNTHDWSAHVQADHSHAALATDELVDHWTVSGSARHCVDKLRELEKVGVDRFCAFLFDLSPEELDHQIRVIGEQIIPEFQTTAAAL
jgi:alkanesulfonate monooxygenase SsuD/methylene tetrahydromethanopterin reductase-like flavin-dependent oxidoreductase (luciferase family)